MMRAMRLTRSVTIRRKHKREVERYSWLRPDRWPGAYSQGHNLNDLRSIFTSAAWLRKFGAIPNLPVNRIQILQPEGGQCQLPQALIVSPARSVCLIVANSSFITRP